MPGLNIPEERKRACLWAEEESISQDSNNVHLAEQWMQDVLDAEPDVAATLAHLQTFMEREEVPLREVVFCGCGEPLIRLDHVLEISRVLKRQGVRIRVNTNGHAPLIHGLEVVDRLKGVVDAVSISLNAQDALTYIRLSRPAAGEDAFEALLEFSEECVQAIGDVTLSMVYLGPEETAGMGFHLDVDACRSLAEKMGAAFRVR
ncbi:MAG: TatD family nuclease-associated radical SAM protein [Planctomycetota bacterium]|jgi:TatD family-associated radical SAM protein